jgi:hypothetical protein
MPHVNPGVFVLVLILFLFYRGHAQISKELPEVRGVPEIRPPQEDAREERNTRALLGFSTDMPWNPYRVPLSSRSRRRRQVCLRSVLAICRVQCCTVHCETVPPFPCLCCLLASFTRQASSGAVAAPREVPVVPARGDIQHTDYVTSTEPVDLADHESFFWT